MSRDLNSMLSEYARQPLPNVTGPSSAEIWREIEKRRRRSLWSRISSALELPEPLAQPRWMIAVLAFAAAVGVVPAAIIGRAEKERQLARHSIHLEVFTVGASTVNSVLLRANATGETIQ